MRKAESLYQSKVTSSFACIHDQETKHTTVKWPIAGFTKQWTTFTRAQSAILRSRDFNLRVQRRYKLNSLSSKLPYLFNANKYSSQKWNAGALKIVKKELWSVIFPILKYPIFNFNQNLLHRIFFKFSFCLLLCVIKKFS